jgi:hypothetical protein
VLRPDFINSLRMLPEISNWPKVYQ